MGLLDGIYRLCMYQRTFERRKTTMKIITAGELKVGMMLPEADGFLFDVIKIEKETDKTITIRLASDFSSFKSHWTINGGIPKTFRKSTKIYTA